MNKRTPTQLFKRITTLFVVLLVVCATFGVTAPRLLIGYAASAPNLVTYQGRILNTSAVPVSDASVSMKFEFYTAASGGVCVWSNSSADCDTDTPASTTARTVTLSDGLFSENLGDTADASAYAAIADTVFGDNAAIFLQVYIAGETLTPRKAMTAAPYALNADTIDGIDSSVFNLWTDGGATTYLTSTTDDFAIGGSDPTAAAFGVDESGNIVYIGDGSTVNGSIVFKASDSDTGTLTYNTDDIFSFSGGDVDIDGLTAWSAVPGSTTGMLNVSGIFSVSASGGAGTYNAFGTRSVLSNTSTEGGSINQILYGSYFKSSNDSSGQLDYLYGQYAEAENTSTDVSAIGSVIYGIFGYAQNNATGVTVPEANGIVGQVRANQGTITTARGVYGLVAAAGGIITTSIGGDFSNTSNGATRYGVRATASGGGVANYSGYFYGAPLFIDNSSTPTTPALVDGAGDLYVFDQLEVGGANQTDGAVIKLDSGTLTTGAGLQIRRADSITDFTGLQGLVNFTIDDTASTGNLLYLNHDGVGTSLYIDQVGDDIALDVRGLGTSDYLATFDNDGNSDTNMGISIQACADVGPTGDCNYIIFKDGDGTPLGVIEGNGGGVVFASPGSDYAELFPGVYSDFDEGDILSLDSSGNVSLASSSSKMVGAFSTKANTLGNWVEDWQNTGVYVPVALLGQVSVNVNDSGGAISVGDYITLSSTTGVGRKATGVGYVIGQALEPHVSGSGSIEVLVTPSWVAIDILTEDGSATAVNSDLRLTESGTATASTTGQNSNEFILRGSGWNGSQAENLDMTLLTSVTDSGDYGLSIQNDSGTEVAYVSNGGNLAIAGRLYPSDRGTLQTDKYIYYDGSSGAGGDFMRTNASGWGAGSYDFAEMFPSLQTLAAGEVVVFASDDEHVQRSTGKTYDNLIAGVVSTQPGFLAGENIKGHIPVALAGRVPTYVSGENGDIYVGDPLTTSTKGGYAMKATQAGPIVGYAMEAFSGQTGVVTVFIRPSYYDGGKVSDAPGIDGSASGIMSVSNLDLSGSINLNGGSIISIGSLLGINNNWSIAEDGRFTTKGQFVHLVESYQGNLVETYAALSRNITIQLTGTTKLKDGIGIVEFDEVDPEFNDIISNQHAYKVFLTANSATNTLYAVNRTTSGFRIRENNGTSSAIIDWMVIAYHKDFAPEEKVIEDNIAEVEVIEEVKEETTEVAEEELPGEVEKTIGEEEPEITQEKPEVEEVVEEEVVEDIIEEDPVEEEIAEEVVVEESEKIIEQEPTEPELPAEKAVVPDETVDVVIE